MTSLFQARRSAEEFAAAVDRAAPAEASQSAELARWLEVVATLRAHEPVEPRRAFAEDLRARLMLEAETALAPEVAALRLPTRERGRRERRLAVAASAFVLVGGTTTMAAAAQSALPGEALYPVKRGLEQAQASLNLSAAGKGKDLLHQASGRLLEVEGLVGSASPQTEPRVPETLAAFSASATEGAKLLFESFRESGDPAAIIEVRSFATDGIATVESLAATVPATAQDELTAAAVLLRDLDREAAALCGTCAADLPVVEVPGIFLARAEVDRALTRAGQADLDNNHPVVVEKLATRVAPAARPAPADTPTTTPVPTGGPTAAPTPSGVPSPTWQPGSWPTLLPGSEGGETTTKNDERTVVEKATGDLGSGLAGVVETLLPDPDGSLD